MKNLLAVLIVSVFHSTCFADGDNLIKMSETVKAGSVVVKPSTEYEVDLSGYEVPKNAKLMIIHVLASPMSHYYYQEIKDGVALYKMNSETLQATTGSPNFSGLKAGDSAFLIIGSEVNPGSINMGAVFSNESISVIVRD
jgi:hypothetical protein